MIIDVREKETNGLKGRKHPFYGKSKSGEISGKRIGHVFFNAIKHNLAFVTGMSFEK